MDQDFSIITPDMASDLVRAGWSISDWGVAKDVDKVPGYEECLVIMRYGNMPNVGLLEGGAGFRIPTVVSKITPSTQRESHLARPIIKYDQKSLPLVDLIQQNYESIGIKLDPYAIPMVNCFVIMELPEEGVTYWAGRLDIGFRDGAMVVIDRGSWDGSRWVTPESSSLPNSLPIAPSEGLKVQVFSVIGELEPESFTQEIIYANSITVLALVSDLRLGLHSTLDQPRGQNMYGNATQTISFGEMGDNTDTGAFATVGELAFGLIHPILINIVPLLVRKEKLRFSFESLLKDGGEE